MKLIYCYANPAGGIYDQIIAMIIDAHRSPTMVDTLKSNVPLDQEELKELVYM